jgi:hypothetical protein
MTLGELLAALRRKLAHGHPPRDDIDESESNAEGEVSVGPEGPLGPTGGQIGNPQRFS